MNNLIQKLTGLFMDFPGIGPRQAKRFVYHLLHTDPIDRQALASAILELGEQTSQCDRCLKFFPQNGGALKLCSICQNQNREDEMIMVVEKDIDLENVEKSGNYNGQYFVLGGLLPLLDKNPEKKIRSKELFERIKKDLTENKLKEVILALSANSAGDYTADYLSDLLKPFKEKVGLKITLLGRGLSTGTELEYSDPDTIRNALKNRG